MIRITRFSTNRSLQPAESLHALEAAQQLAEAAAKVQGVRSVKVGLSGGNIVFVGENDDYATADAILADAGVQAAGARLTAEFGYRPAGDEFIVDVGQVAPFMRS